MSRQELLTEYYTARWRYHLAKKGTKTGWERRLKEAFTACLRAGVPV